MKLCRNALEAIEEFEDGDGLVIRWSHLDLLVKLQDKKGFTFGTKVGKRHIYFHQQVMMVRLASQLLSRSCADAIEFLMEQESLALMMQLKLSSSSEKLMPPLIYCTLVPGLARALNNLSLLQDCQSGEFSSKNV